MLVRDSEGRLIIISRKECKNENVYNDKLFNIRLKYTNKYKNIFVNSTKITLNNSKDFSNN